MFCVSGQSHSDIKPPDYSMNINPGFTQNPVQYGVQASQPSQFVQPGKQFQPIQQGVQSLSSSLHQQGFKMAEDDFGDFQGIRIFTFIEAFILYTQSLKILSGFRRRFPLENS